MSDLSLQSSSLNTSESSPQDAQVVGGDEFTIIASRRFGSTIYLVGQYGHEVARFQYKRDAKQFVAKQSATLSSLKEGK